MKREAYTVTFFSWIKLYFEIRNVIYHVKIIIILILEILFAFWLAANLHDWKGEKRNYKPTCYVKIKEHEGKPEDTTFMKGFPVVLINCTEA